MSYRPAWNHIVRTGGHYVGRILAGADPAELTFEQSRKFAVGYTRVVPGTRVLVPAAHPVMWTVAPLRPHRAQRAEPRSTSLDASEPHRMIHSASAVGERCWQRN